MFRPRPRVRVVMEPVSTVTGERREGPTVVLTYPRHRFLSRWRRFSRANDRNPAIVTPEDHSRYRITAMTEDHYQGHKPAGPVRHLGDTVARFGEIS